MNTAPFCAVVPAAGAGARMGGPTPKQYLPLAGATVLEWALAPILARPGLMRLVVALAPDDRAFAGLVPVADTRIRTVRGGASRAQSVRAGIEALADLDEATTVIVHDAARPCLEPDDLAALMESAAAPAGALLALPVCDTLKRAGEGESVAATVDRTRLWQALTPQAFPLGLLRGALDDAANRPEGITDEAAAVERLGFAPRLVAGKPTNVKVTHPDQLPLAEAILAARTGSAP